MSGFFDLEELRFGTPAEDLVRYVVCREEHRKWYDLYGQQRLLAAFWRILARTSYSRAEWMFAINGYLLRKLAKKVKSNYLPIWRRINLCARLGFYHALRHVVIPEAIAGFYWHKGKKIPPHLTCRPTPWVKEMWENP